MKNLLSLSLGIALLFSCGKTQQNDFENGEPAEGQGEYVEYNNPPAEGFNLEGSDVLAMLLADKTMAAMGGRKAWDETRYLTWNFFGSRKHIWDKESGDVRIEAPSRNLTILMNINSKEGQVMQNGEVLSNPDSLAKYLDLGYRMWVNDSYWLVMPYKLKDSGVTLSYFGDDTTAQGKMADVIRLSFEDVGVTPENAYNIWIDVETKLVTQWAYYQTADADTPRFVNPWGDYNQYGQILLSGDRGRNALTEIEVLEEVPSSIFTSFETLTQ